VCGIGEALTISFFGVRGSTPCDGRDLQRYGGNTSSVLVDAPGHDPIVLDLGTGSRRLGHRLVAEGVDHVTCLLSHLHWDHVQGLPFFPMALQPGKQVDIHGPAQDDDRTIADALRDMWKAPAFPVTIDDLPATLRFVDHADDEFAIGDVRVTTRTVPHIGSTIGYRLEWNGRCIAYVSDHQQPGIDVYEMSDGVRELCRGADVLIHDAQYTRDEFGPKASWGHCTVDYAVWLAIDCGVKTVALYHHDPTHDDDLLDEIAARLRAEHGGTIEIVMAAEGASLVVGEPR
jgi:phosphoribosyl 1,2-cyclic phosphodiesterase